MNLVFVLEDFDNAIKLNPRLESAYNSRGIVKCELSDFNVALQDYNKVIEIEPKYAGGPLSVMKNRKEFGAALNWILMYAMTIVMCIIFASQQSEAQDFRAYIKAGNAQVTFKKSPGRHLEWFTFENHEFSSAHYFDLEDEITIIVPDTGLFYLIGTDTTSIKVTNLDGESAIVRVNGYNKILGHSPRKYWAYDILMPRAKDEIGDY